MKQVTIATNTISRQYLERDPHLRTIPAVSPVAVIQSSLFILEAWISNLMTAHLAWTARMVIGCSHVEKVADAPANLSCILLWLTYAKPFHDPAIDVVRQDVSRQQFFTIAVGTTFHNLLRVVLTDAGQ